MKREMKEVDRRREENEHGQSKREERRKEWTDKEKRKIKKLIEIEKGKRKGNIC